jgi:hypothetical protein
MTLRVPRLRFALDPLVAEAKRRMRRRRIFVAVVLAVAIAGTTVAVIATRPSPQENGRGATAAGQMRSCGILGVGIGWHVSASPTMSCQSGMTLMRAYFRGSLANRTVLGYACTSHRAGGRISCARGENRSVAIANN